MMAAKHPRAVRVYGGQKRASLQAGLFSLSANALLERCGAAELSCNTSWAPANRLVIFFPSHFSVHSIPTRMISVSAIFGTSYTVLNPVLTSYDKNVKFFQTGITSSHTCWRGHDMVCIILSQRDSRSSWICCLDCDMLATSWTDGQFFFSGNICQQLEGCKTHSQRNPNTTRRSLTDN